MEKEIANLTTEAINPATVHIDKCSALEIVKLINTEDKKVAKAVEGVLQQIALAVEGIVKNLSRGGRLFYIGAGTSGRLGVLDASECPPTFGVSSELVQGLIAGGNEALVCAIEGAEDDSIQAEKDLASRDFCAKDILVGITASGRTPYVLSGIKTARCLGALTIGVSCTENSLLAKIVDIAITPITGAEVLAGSTRLKAGTATKMILNMLTTASMIKLGRVQGNLMIYLQASNNKLRDRLKRFNKLINRGRRNGNQ